MYWPEMDTLSDEHVAETYELIAELIEGRCPEWNPRRGVVGDQVTKLQAILHTASLTAVERVHKSLSLLEIERNPDAALPEAVDALASNFGVERGVAQKARGRVTLILRRASGINISANQCFIARGQRFFPQQAFNVVQPDAPIRSAKQVAARALDDGTFVVDIPMVSQNADPAASLRANDALQPVLRPPGFIAAYAAEDFTGCEGVQSNAELVRQMRSGLAPPGFSSPENIKSLVRQVVPHATDIHVTGEQGKVCIHLQSLAYPRTNVLRKEAVLKSKDVSTAVWECSLDADQASGFYRVESIRMPATGPAGRSCKVITAEDTITFAETGETFGLVPGQSTKQFDVVVLYMPYISTVQEWVTSPDVHIPGLEVTVEAVSPRFAKATVETDGPLDEEAVRNALASYVNTLPIGANPKMLSFARTVEDADNIVSIVFDTAGGVLQPTETWFLHPDDVTIA